MTAIYDFIINHPYLTAASCLGLGVFLIWLAPTPEFLLIYAVGTHFFQLVLQFSYIKQNVMLILASTLTIAEKTQLFQYKLMQIEWLLFQAKKLPIREFTRPLITQFLNDLTEYYEYILTLM